MGLFDIAVEHHDGEKDIIKIMFGSGLEKPYYLRKRGMSPKGCFIRIGSASEPMTARMIEDLFACRIRNSIGRIASRRQDLTFEQLKIYYNETPYKLNDRFAHNLELLTADGKYNYAAYLLADNSGCSIKVAKYAGKTRVDLVENEEYGYCCLVKATNAVLEKLKIENRTFARITDTKRIDRADSFAGSPYCIGNPAGSPEYRRSPPYKSVCRTRFPVFGERVLVAMPKESALADRAQTD